MTSKRILHVIRPLLESSQTSLSLLRVRARVDKEREVFLAKQEKWKRTRESLSDDEKQELDGLFYHKFWECSVNVIRNDEQCDDYCLELVGMYEKGASTHFFCDPGRTVADFVGDLFDFIAISPKTARTGLLLLKLCIDSGNEWATKNHLLLSVPLLLLNYLATLLCTVNAGVYPQYIPHLYEAAYSFFQYMVCSGNEWVNFDDFLRFLTKAKPEPKAIRQIQVGVLQHFCVLFDPHQSDFIEKLMFTLPCKHLRLDLVGTLIQSYTAPLSMFIASKGKYHLFNGFLSSAALKKFFIQLIEAVPGMRILIEDNLNELYFYFIEKKWPQLIKFLAHANPSVIHLTDTEGNTPLLYACGQRGKMEKIVAYLISKGSDMGARNYKGEGICERAMKYNKGILNHLRKFETHKW